MCFKFLLIGEFIRENLFDPPTQEDLCQKFEVPEYGLRKGFKKTHGMNLGEYLRCQRMKTAARLLLSTENSVSIVAECVGFRNSSRFAEAFRKEYGVNPLHYRKALNWARYPPFHLFRNRQEVWPGILPVASSAVSKDARSR